MFDARVDHRQQVLSFFFGLIEFVPSGLLSIVKLNTIIKVNKLLKLTKIFCVNTSRRDDWLN